MLALRLLWGGRRSWGVCRICWRGRGGWRLRRRRGWGELAKPNWRGSMRRIIKISIPVGFGGSGQKALGSRCLAMGNGWGCQLPQRLPKKRSRCSGSMISGCCKSRWGSGCWWWMMCRIMASSSPCCPVIKGFGCC